MRTFKLFTIAFCIIGAVFFFGRTILLPIDIIRNYPNILAGTYIAPEIGDSMFYSFSGWAIGNMILFGLCPSDDRTGAPHG